ncbi:saccharopine dehydrogenase [Pseudomonas sp. CrR25]|nr:saccharopine dehydrogenase [Pseudomonas sp. CrR25]
MSDIKVVLYGASGYTGKLVARHLAEQGISFIAAGRSAEKIRNQLASLPELANANYEVVEVAHEEAALTQLLAGKTVIYNTVGPFMQLAEPVVKAALESGCHYLDSTGEQDWMLFLRREYGAAYAEKKLLLLPALAFMWAAGHLAAEICLETPGIDTLDIVYVTRGTLPSVSSTLSFLRMCCQPQYYLSQNELMAWEPATAYQTVAPTFHQVLDCLPWSGGGEPVWYLDDPRVRNCSMLVNFGKPEVMKTVLQLTREFNEKYKDLPQAEQEQVTNGWGSNMTPVEPPREDPLTCRAVISCHASGPASQSTVILQGNCGYEQAGAVAVKAIELILADKIRCTGFVSPGAAFGARNLVESLERAGLATLIVRN